MPEARVTSQKFYLLFILIEVCLGLHYFFKHVHITSSEHDCPLVIIRCALCMFFWISQLCDPCLHCLNCEIPSALAILICCWRGFGYLAKVEIQDKDVFRRELIFVRYIERTLKRYKSRRRNFVFAGDIFRRVLSVENNIYWQHYSEICCYFPKILEWFLFKLLFGVTKMWHVLLAPTKDC